MIFYFWVALMVIAILSVPIAAKMSGGGSKKKKAAPDEGLEQADSEEVALGDEFDAEPAAEEIGDDAFAETP